MGLRLRLRLRLRLDLRPLVKLGPNAVKCTFLPGVHRHLETCFLYYAAGDKIRYLSY